MNGRRFAELKDQAEMDHNLANDVMDTASKYDADPLKVMGAIGASLVAAYLDEELGPGKSGRLVESKIDSLAGGAQNIIASVVKSSPDNPAKAMASLGLALKMLNEMVGRKTVSGNCSCGGNCSSKRSSGPVSKEDAIRDLASKLADILDEL